MMYSENEKKLKALFWTKLILFLVGIHSILLGLFIYFFTDVFYKIFFDVTVENIFFVRQSGVFLFLAGVFYLYPLINLKNLYHMILLVVFSKIVAVIFLISNAPLTKSQVMIYLAAFFDGLMAVVLVGAYFSLIKMNKAFAKKSILSEESARVKEAA